MKIIIFKVYLLGSFCLHVCRHARRRHQIPGYERTCGCRELNSGLSEEQSVLLTSESSISLALITNIFMEYFLLPSELEAIFMEFW